MKGESMALKTVAYKVMLNSGLIAEVEADGYNIPNAEDINSIMVLDYVWIEFTKNDEVVGRFRLSRVDGFMPIREEEV